MEKLKSAIIGSGTMAEMFHIPAAINSQKVVLTGIYDLDASRAKEIAQKYDIPCYGSNYHTDLDEYDAAIVAVPNKYHAAISSDLMKNGKHVLVEKPMAVSSSECADMIAISKSNGVVLTVGMIRRFYPGNQFIKTIIENAIFGEIDSIDVQEGAIFGWPMSSDSFIRKNIVGGGILLDAGVHVIDLLHWWIGNLECLEYRDDACEGLEADCEISFTSKKVGNISVKLSRQRNLSNSMRINFEKLTVEIGCDFESMVKIIPKTDSAYTISGFLQRNKIKKDFIFIMIEQLEDFVDAALKKKEPFIDPESAAKSIQTIEGCYRLKKEITYAWEAI